MHSHTHACAHAHLLSWGSTRRPCCPRGGQLYWVVVLRFQGSPSPSGADCRAAGQALPPPRVAGDVLVHSPGWSPPRSQAAQVPSLGSRQHLPTSPLDTPRQSRVVVVSARLQLGLCAAEGIGAGGGAGDLRRAEMSTQRGAPTHCRAPAPMPHHTQRQPSPYETTARFTTSLRPTGRGTMFPLSNTGTSCTEITYTF